MARAVVVDVHGEQVAHRLYADDGSASVVVLPPTRAVLLAGKLIDAAVRRLSR